MHASKDEDCWLLLYCCLSSIILNITIGKRIDFLDLNYPLWNSQHGMKSQSLISLLILIIFCADNYPFISLKTVDPYIFLESSLGLNSPIDNHFFINSCCSMVSSRFWSLTKVYLLLPCFFNCVEYSNIIETLTMVLFFAILLFSSKDIELFLVNNTRVRYSSMRRKHILADNSSPLFALSIVSSNKIIP